MMGYKQSRVISLIIIAAAYALAAALGIAVFFWLKANLVFWQSLLFADIAATAVIFLVSLITDNASVYDPYWSVQPLVILPLAMVYFGAYTFYSVALVIVVAVWGIRLTANWLYTFKNLTEQDWRYDNIKRASGRAYPLASFFGIQLMPTLVVFVCMMPALLFFENGGSGSLLSIVGCLVCLFGTGLELVSDMTKHAYRKNGGKGVVNVGIWRKRRHPNYLGEIVFWWGVYLFVLFSAIELWYTVYGAVVNTLLFVFISIPMAERQSALRHGQQWEEYLSESRTLI